MLYPKRTKYFNYVLLHYQEYVSFDQEVLDRAPTSEFEDQDELHLDFDWLVSTNSRRVNALFG